MEKEILMKFKAMFLQEKAKLSTNLEKLTQKLEISKEELFDESDLSSFEINQALQLRLQGRESVFLTKIEEALTRLENGTFGVCECCDEPIEQKRLEARPTTTLCILCKEDQEKREAVYTDEARLSSRVIQVKFA